LHGSHLAAQPAADKVGAEDRYRSTERPTMRQQGHGRRLKPHGASLISALASARKVLLVLGRLVAGNGLLDVLNRQLQLLRIELLRAAAELRALQLAQEVPQAIHLRQRVVALGDRRVAFGDRGVALRACRHD
jgi:hypothetical protein